VYLISLLEIARSSAYHHYHHQSASSLTKPPTSSINHLVPTMSADTQTQPLSLSKVDSAIDDTPASPTESKIKHRRTSSTVSGVFNINDLGE
jgi:hypothetical protein